MIFFINRMKFIPGLVQICSIYLMDKKIQMNLSPSVCFSNWLHSLVHLLQQLVTECTDRLPAKQPSTITSTTGYSIPTGYTALYSSFNNWLKCADQVLAAQPALNSWLHISRLQRLLACYQPAPRNHQPKGLLPADHSSPAANSPA